MADVNGDGHPDIVVTNQYSNNVAVLLGNGDGTFQPAVTYGSGGSGPLALAVADLNGDGHPDLAVVNSCGRIDCGHGLVAVLLNHGDGTFAPAVAYDSGGNYATAVAIADVNGDQKPDLLVADFSSGTVGVLLGNGDGTFQPVVTSSVGGYGSVAVAALGTVPAVIVVNGYDLRFRLNGNVAVMFPIAGGTLSPPTSYHSGGSMPISLAVGDVYPDGIPDMVVANIFASGTDTGNGEVGALLNLGGDEFVGPFRFSSGGKFPTSVAVGDVNLDGIPDVVVANFSSQDIGVLLGTGMGGRGTLRYPQTFNTGGSPQSVAVADVNGDDKPDVLVANWYGGPGGDGLVGVLLNNTEFHTSTFTTLSSSPNPSIYGQSVTFTVEVATSSRIATGTVQLLYGSIVVGTGTLVDAGVSIPVSTLPAGADVITASYLGGNGFLPSKSNPVTQTVTPAVTATSLSSSLNPAATNQPITFTAAVTSQYGGAASGTVVFMSGSQSLGSALLSGSVATLTTSFATAGTYSITAKYSGDSNNTASTSPSLVQLVTKSPTSSTLASSLNPSIYGQKVIFTSTVTTTGPLPATGRVAFTWGGTYTIGTATLNSSGVAALVKSNLNADAYPLTAVYKGDVNNLGSTSLVLNQVVQQTTSTASITSSPNPSTVGQAVTFTAKITSPTVLPTGPVTFKAGTTVLGTAQLSGGKATFTTSSLPAGSTIVKVIYNGDSNIKKSSASVTQVVQP